MQQQLIQSGLTQCYTLPIALLVNDELSRNFNKAENQLLKPKEGQQTEEVFTTEITRNLDLSFLFELR